MAVTLKDATLTGNRVTGELDRLYPNMGLGLSYDLDEYQTQGGKFLLPQWQPPYFQTIKSVTDEALIGVPMYVYIYPEEGYEFKSVTVNGKEIKSQWFMISEAAEIKVNFAEIGAEPSVAFTVPQGQKMSFLVNTATANGTIAVDWGTGTRTEYPDQTAYIPGSYRIGGTRIDGTAAGTTVTIYGDLAAVSATWPLTSASGTTPSRLWISRMPTASGSSIYTGTPLHRLTSRAARTWRF